MFNPGSFRFPSPSSSCLLLIYTVENVLSLTFWLVRQFQFLNPKSKATTTSAVAAFACFDLFSWPEMHGSVTVTCWWNGHGRWKLSGGADEAGMLVVGLGF